MTFFVFALSIAACDPGEGVAGPDTTVEDPVAETTVPDTTTTSTSTTTTTTLPPTTTTSPVSGGEADRCTEEAILEPVVDELLGFGMPAEAIEHALFHEMICSGDFASIRVERLSDPGSRVVLEASADGWVVLEPFTAWCDDRELYGVPEDDWREIMPNAAQDSETGWVDCFPD